MRKYFLLWVGLGVIFSFQTLHAQQAKLWGLTENGGDVAGQGTLFNVNTDGTGFTKLHVFDATTPGATPVGTPLLANNGKIYGLTETGGGSNVGVLYSYDTASKLYTLLYSFNDSSGYNPMSSLMQATDGKIYGVTSIGGYGYNDYGGSIFCYDPVRDTFSVLYLFDYYSGGYAPGTPLIQYTDGKLYGIATAGGTNNGGVLFSYDITTGVYQAVYNFTSAQTGTYCSSITMDPSRTAIYGLVADSPNFVYGAIFSYKPADSSFNVLIDFHGSSLYFGAYGQLTAVTDSLFFVVSTYVFKIDLTAREITNVDNIDETPGITLRDDGKLYGLGNDPSIFEGSNYLFSLDTAAGYQRTVVKTFTNPANNGSQPSGAPFITSSGEFYYTWQVGGEAYPSSGIFSYYNSKNNTDTSLFYFNASPGANPRGSLLRVNNVLYGMTSTGGTHGYGTVFKYNITTSLFTTIHNFDDTDGAYTNQCYLMQAANGKLYGATGGGGSNYFSSGVIYSIDPASDTFSLVCSSAGSPIGSMVQAHNGKLYGVNSSGIFSFDPDSLIFSQVHTFDSIENGFAGFDGTMVLASDSNFYGVTNTCLFRFNPDSNLVTDLVFYPGEDYTPYYSVVQDTNGLLYGTMPVRYGLGYFYSYNPITAIYYQYQNDTAGTLNSFLVGRDTKLYAMANVGGGNGYGFTSISNAGAIYSYNIQTSTFDELLPFNINTGYSPLGGLIETDTCFTTITSAQATICQGDTFLLGVNPLTKNGIYTDTTIVAGGCDSIVILQLTILPADSTFFTASICPGSTYSFFGTDEMSAGSYSHTLQNVNGCDSVITLSLSVYQPVDTTVIVASICAGTTYSFFGTSELTGGNYSYTLQNVNGCDSIVTLYLTVLPVDSSSFTATICSGDTFPFFGTSGLTGGNYSYTLHNINGCDSIVTLQLTVLPVDSSSFTATICNGDTFPFFGTNELTGGNYSYTLQNVNGCDSIVTLQLTVLPIDSSSFTATICSGDTFPFFGTSELTGGNYSYTLQNINGCDSIVTLQLTVLPIDSSSFTATICSGDTFPFFGTSELTGGSYSYTLQSVNGCDSIVTLQLTVLPIDSSSFTATICSGDTFPFFGTSELTGGSYSYTLQSVNGCDSVVILQLTVLPVDSSSFTATICSGDTFPFFGTSELTGGNYSYTLQNINGCDSVVTVNLVVLPPDSSSLSAAICPGDTFPFFGTMETTGGDYVHTMQNGNGCYSVVTLHLTVYPAATPPVLTATDSTICPGDSTVILSSGYYQAYRWNTGATTPGIHVDTAGSYYVQVTDTNGCKAVSGSMKILEYPVEGISIYVRGDTLSTFGGIGYQWYRNGTPITGADSSEYVACLAGIYGVQVTYPDGCKFISQVPPIDGIERTGDCNVGLPQLDATTLLNIYPNPSTGTWQIEAGGDLLGSALEIYDDEGRLVFKSQIRNLQSEITLDIAAGIYYLRISSTNTNLTRKLIKL